MATPTAIHTGLEVAANNAAPTPAPIAIPAPVLRLDGLLAMASLYGQDGIDIAIANRSPEARGCEFRHRCSIEFRRRQRWKYLDDVEYATLE